jgi:hypothetical protein
MERVYTHVSPEHLKGQMQKRTSKAFAVAAADQKDLPSSTAVGEMSVDQIKVLSLKLAEELARRNTEKC